MGDGSGFRHVAFAENLVYWSGFFATCVLTFSIVVLAGWQFDIDFLKSFLPGLVAMNPMTAIGFMAAAVSILLLRKGRRSMKGVVYFSFCFIPFILGLVKTGDIFFHVESGIDRILFSSKLDIDAPNGVPNRMAPNTAFNFVLTGIALMFIHVDIKGRHVLSQYVALPIAFVGLLTVIGYIYDVTAFYGVLSYIPMAIHTAIGFLFISFSILFHKPDKGLMWVFSSDLEGSKAARLLVPVAILIPVFLGYIRLLGQRNGLYSNELGGALLIVTIIVTFISFIWYHSYVLNKRDGLRRSAEVRIGELNEELTQINSQLANVNHELEAFTYSVSHDLRAPLRSVIGFADIIEEDFGHGLDVEVHGLLRNVNRSAKKMNTLIDDLLEFSKLGKAEVTKSKVNVKELVEIVWEDLRNSMPHSAQLLLKEVHPVYADRSLLQQVMINLISNAIKYSSKKAKPVVKISSEIKGNEIEYIVSDNGAGFDMKYADKLFGVFQRLHKAADFEGTGVGLAIVQRIISRHSGRIWAESTAGEGATFRFTLPYF